MRRCRGQLAAPPPATAWLKCAPSGPGASSEAAVDTGVTQDWLETARAAEAAARQSYGKLIAYLSARTRDVAGAEDALSEAFAAALAEWPVRGVPNAPEAWLLTVARRKLVD